MDPIFERFHAGLLHAHGELTTALAAILAADRVRARPIAAFCQELLNHHRAEDRFFFPAFRAAGRLRSTDVAFLHARDAEHRDIHRLCLAIGGLGPGDRAEVQRVGRELAGISAPHFALEEAALTGVHLAEMLTARELAAVYRDMGQNWLRD